MSRGRAPALALALLMLLSCDAPQSTVCASGRICAPGYQCAVDQDACIPSGGCGDGIRQAGEACDDGNIIGGDGCSADCLSDEICGNGHTDTAAGEVCDDGNTTSGDGCSADCHSKEICGNGYVDVAKGEVCDDGNSVNGDGCSANCLSKETCGNGYPDVLLGEVCDDGNTTSGDGCSADCLSKETCGNGVVELGEECDKGPGFNSDHGSCLSTCKIARCGDGMRNDEMPYKEQCDDGHETATCNSNCTNNVCGDNIVNAHAGEECDMTDRTKCNANCTIVGCGDGIVSTTSDELCDDGNHDACGTCGTECQKHNAFAQATGNISIPPRTAIQPGETFTISDGIKRAVFRFELTTEPLPPSTAFVPVPIAASATMFTIASSITLAINSTLPNLEASTQSSPIGVTIKHKHAGTFGNQTILETVLDSGFSVEGMSGGAGVGCSENIGCVSNDDCAFGLKCTPLGVVKRCTK